MIEFQLTVFMCSNCTRVYNSADPCREHEAHNHRVGPTTTMQGYFIASESIPPSHPDHRVNSFAPLPATTMGQPPTCAQPSEVVPLPPPSPTVNTMPPNAERSTMKEDTDSIICFDTESSGRARSISDSSEDSIFSTKVESINEIIPLTADGKSSPEKAATEKAAGTRRKGWGTGPHKCAKCALGFVRANSLRRHIASCDGRRFQRWNNVDNKCHLCHQSFSTMEDLATHFKTEHLPHTNKEGFVHVEKGRKRTSCPSNTFECPVCNKRFIAPSHLRMHMRTHTGERPFPCKMCEYGATTNGNLKKHHINVHKVVEGGDDRSPAMMHDNNPYSCTFCNFSSRYVAAMTRHEKTRKHILAVMRVDGTLL